MKKDEDKVGQDKINRFILERLLALNESGVKTIEMIENMIEDIDNRLLKIQADVSVLLSYLDD